MTDVLNIAEVIHPDELAVRISTQYITWEGLRANRVSEWKELQRYLYATSTNDTTNSSLPWSNKTTIPKICQIADNLYANYMAALFPRRKWLVWEGDSEVEETKAKKDTIEGYMSWVVDRSYFYTEVSRLVLDYIHYGNVFVMPSWSSQKTADGKSGYEGPVPRRIAPTDIVFDPTSPDFMKTPKIVRSMVSLGDVKKMLFDKQFATVEEQESANKLFNHLLECRNNVAKTPNLEIKDDIYQVAGFSNYRDYLASDSAEILTFYGDVYDGQTFYQNKIIKIIDRVTVLSIEDNPSVFGYFPIFHAGWRMRPDNLWAMGPLDNLVGMQYRIDHLENMKADVFDVIAYPPLKVKGHVMDFQWAPMERIYIGDDGDVTMLTPDTQALQADTQISILEAKMEEMAGSPKEAMGFRTPGEKTAFEVQRLELAAGRIFQNRTAAFERDVLEPLLNAMLEIARRYMTASTIRVFDTDNKIAVFKNLTVDDLTGQGRIRPVAARHFAEKALVVQNINSFMSGAGQDQAIKVHFSGLEMAKMWESLLELEPYHLVEPYIQITEQADAQRMLNSVQQQVAQEANTPSGIYPGDSDFANPNAVAPAPEGTGAL